MSNLKNAFHHARDKHPIIASAALGAGVGFAAAILWFGFPISVPLLLTWTAGEAGLFAGVKTAAMAGIKAKKIITAKIQNTPEEDRSRVTKAFVAAAKPINRVRMFYLIDDINRLASIYFTQASLSPEGEKGLRQRYNDALEKARNFADKHYPQDTKIRDEIDLNGKYLRGEAKYPRPRYQSSKTRQHPGM